MQFEVKVNSLENWGNGGNGNITITNKGVTITNWKFNLTTHNFVINEFWQLVKEGSGSDIIIHPPSWKTTLAAGETFNSGFSYTNTEPFESLRVSSTTPGVIIINESQTPPPPSPSLVHLNSVKKVFGYFTEWSVYDRQYNVDMIPVTQLTHILYAFMLPNPSQQDYDILAANYPYPPKPYYPPPQIPEGTLVYHDEVAGKANIAKLKQIKGSNPNIKILVSIGGWTLSWTLSKIVANATLKSNLIKSSVRFLIDNGFDGFDIDWEYVGKQGIGYNYVDIVNDRPNFIQFLRELRHEMNQQSPNKYLEITSAISSNPDVIKNYEGTEPYIDYCLLMVYDLAGAWGDGGHHTPLYDHPGKTENSQYNAHSAVFNAMKIGYAPSKIILGCPMYGRGWAKIIPTDPTQPIFGESVSGPANSHSGLAGEPGMTSWRHLVNVVDTNGLQRYYDNIAKAVYIHNSSTGETWSYEDNETIKDKGQYVIDNKLAGMMFWELSDDTRNNLETNILQNAIIILNQSPNEVPPSDPDDGTTPSENLTITITNNNLTDFVLKPGQTITIKYQTP